MIPGMPGNQITPEQAPPISLPLLFFASGTVFLVVAGIAGVVMHEALLISNWMPLTLGFTHFVTLGFLASIMMGALYQMVPVVAGKPVPWIRLGYAALFCHLIGSGSLILGLSTLSFSWIHIGLMTEILAMCLFIFPVGIAVFKAPISHPSVHGMRIALTALILTISLGVILGMAHLGVPYKGLRTEWLQAHITFGALGWVGMLIVSVSWQVIPMFYLTPQFGKKGMNIYIKGMITLLFLMGLGLTLSVQFQSMYLLNLASWGVMLLVWLVHPVQCLVLFSQRRRHVRDGSLLFWKLGTIMALVCIPMTGLAFFSSRPELSLLAGWIALWGWAACIVHGMLYRIIPFLLWFHKFSGFVGRQRVPSMKSLLPESMVSLGFYAHGTTLILGIIAIIYAKPAMVISWSLGIFVTGLVLIINMLRALFRTKRALQTMSKAAIQPEGPY